TCGHTAASSRLPSRLRWGTSTAASLRRSAAKSPPSNPASSSLVHSSRSTTTCPNCQIGYQSSCQHAEFVGTAQVPLLRVPPGWFAADAANVKPGKTVAVVGDGAVGLLGVLSAKQMGAERIIVMSRISAEARARIRRDRYRDGAR